MGILIKLRHYKEWLRESECGEGQVTNMKKNQKMSQEKIRAFRDRKDEMMLNDYLAVERTRLSIERTHLSYMRTVVSMVVAGITLYKLVPGWEGMLAAGILMVSAIYFYIRGKKVCNATDRNLRYIEDEDD